MTPVEKYVNPAHNKLFIGIQGAAFTLGTKEITRKVDTLRVANKVWMKVLYPNESC